ncbi:hypothetical protein [Arachnia propionica]|uniref:Uncharacterized protein n=1 Tax=Arachnia propionica TaxID=1750 RepID=A0A3P1WNV7_9ACTN|nr:hypothetical protein [Arachnia propionica]RRD47616.1 hypothetical protein EII35_14840 [Arachnia propionica]
MKVAGAKVPKPSHWDILFTPSVRAFLSRWTSHHIAWAVIVVMEGDDKHKVTNWIKESLFVEPDNAWKASMRAL